MAASDEELVDIEAVTWDDNAFLPKTPRTFEKGCTAFSLSFEIEE